MKPIIRQDFILVSLSCHSQLLLDVTEVQPNRESNGRERLIQVSDDVVSVFNSD
jgi:hypothetical protein